MTDPLAEVRETLRTAVAEAAAREGAPADFRPELERPRDADHGDLSTNAALVLAGRVGRPPRELAEVLARELDGEAGGIASVEVAGAGFLNFRLTDRVYWEGLPRILEANGAYGRREAEDPRRFNVEFVSANPTGPLHVAHGRGAAVGDVVASLLEWTGHEVSREFYVNDAGRQIDLLGASVEARYREIRGEPAEVPEGGYHGEYVRDLASRLARRAGEDTLDGLSTAERTERFAREASELLLQGQAEDLAAFGIEMNEFRHETALYTENRVVDTLERLRAADLTYEEDGAVWLATSRFGDEKDRVLVKRDGSYTYFLPDIAYHLDKRERGFDRAVDVLGADHHGHVGRMRAALDALGLRPDFLEAVILQLVTVVRGGEEVRMSKRAGQFVTLRDLFGETGVDVARYFFLMRRSEVPLTFDLDLALERSDRNPVYKIQYAHARMCSVFEKGGVDPKEVGPEGATVQGLGTEAERDLAKALLRFPEVVVSAAKARAPYQVCGYLEEAAGLVNSWYHEGNLDPSLRVLVEGPERSGRLVLARAVQITLRNGLRLLGISAPQRMVREEEREEQAA